MIPGIKPERLCDMVLYSCKKAACTPSGAFGLERELPLATRPEPSGLVPPNVQLAPDGLYRLLPKLILGVSKPKLAMVGTTISFVAMTTSVSEIVLFKLPEIPVTVTVFVPVAASASAVKNSGLPAVEFVEANAAVTPLGKPETDSPTPPVNPFTVLTVIILALLPPSVTARLAGNADRLNSGVPLVVPATTVKLSVTGRTKSPPVPTTVTVAGLALMGAVLLAVKVTVLALAALAGLNIAVTPVGRFKADMLTLPEKPLPEMMLTVSVTFAPWLTVRSFTMVPMMLGTVSEKFGAVLVPVRALIVAWPRGLPHPVQRS